MKKVENLAKLVQRIKTLEEEILESMKAAKAAFLIANIVGTQDSVDRANALHEKVQHKMFIFHSTIEVGRTLSIESKHILALKLSTAS